MRKEGRGREKKKVSEKWKRVEEKKQVTYDCTIFPQIFIVVANKPLNFVGKLITITEIWESIGYKQEKK